MNNFWLFYIQIVNIIVFPVEQFLAFVAKTVKTYN